MSVGRGQAQTTGTYGANGRVAGSGDSVLKPTAPRTEPAKQPEAKVAPEPVKKPQPKVVRAPEPQQKPAPKQVVKAPEPEPKQVVRTPEPAAKRPEAQSVTKTVQTQRV